MLFRSDGILRWMQYDTVHVLATDFPNGQQTLIAEALRDQEEIGWPQAMRGFLSSKWRMLEEQHEKEVGHGQAGTGMLTIKVFTKALFALSRALWMGRN